VYAVAAGSRPPSASGWKTSVCEPSQTQRPAGCGDSLTGTLAAASSCEETATIGREKVTLTEGASSTSPRGAKRSTSSGTAAGG
jgi:hypothetical protein